MENLNPNLTPTPAPIPAPVQPTRKYLRTIALSLAGLIIAGGFLAYTGGFNGLSKIFKSKAGTEILFAGFDNLQGSKDADSFVKGDLVPAVFNGTSAFTSFTGIPNDPISGKSVAGFVAPIFSNLDLTLDTFVNHIYTSPAIELGASATDLTQISAYIYLNSDTDQTTVAYRTANTVEELATTSFVILNDLPVVSPVNESLKTITSEVSAGTFLPYLQLQVEFKSFNSASRTAFYGVTLNSPSSDVTTTSTSESPIVGLDGEGGLQLTYSGGSMIPANARIELLSSNLAINPIWTKDDVDFLTAGGEYTVPVQLQSGAYTIVIKGSTIRTIIVPFTATGDSAQGIALGAFEAPIGGISNPDGLSTPTADLNGDGAVNPFDAAILFDQLGDSTP